MSNVSSVKYQQTTLQEGKRGVIPADSNGYYPIVLGAFNAYNTSKAFYPLPAMEKLMTESSRLQRKISNGQLKGEYGHPSLENLTPKQVISRVLQVKEDNICCHIKKVWLEPTPQGPVATWGMVKPSGPKGEYLKASLENPDENVAFSIRSFTQDSYQRGTLVKNVLEVVGWDYVHEPGIPQATKWGSPSVEAFNEVMVSKATVDDLIISYNESGMEQDSSVLTDIRKYLTTKPVSVLYRW